MNIYEHLKADHKSQRRATARILMAPVSTRNQGRLYRAFCNEIQAHMAAKEQTLYAALLASSRNQALVRRVVGEHDRIDELMIELSAKELSNSVWMTEFGRLATMIARHIDREEKYVLPTATSLISEHKAEWLGDSYLRLKLWHTAVWGAAPLESRALLPG